MANPFTTALDSSIFSDECFKEALIDIVYTDLYGLEVGSNNEELEKCRDAIQAHYHVTVILRISRPSPTGGELDTIGFLESRNSSSRIYFWISNASCGVDYIQVSSKETTVDGLAGLMKQSGANLCQIAGTEIVNIRPDLLSRNHLTAVIDQLLEDTEVNWADFDYKTRAVSESVTSRSA